MLFIKLCKYKNYKKRLNIIQLVNNISHYVINWKIESLQFNYLLKIEDKNK